MKSRVQHYAQAHSDLLLLSSGPASPSPSSGHVLAFKKPDNVMTAAKKLEVASSESVLFRCPICDTFFSQRNSLKRHYARTHPGQEPPNVFRCLPIFKIF